MIFVAISTLTACSSDDSETQSGDKSFKKQIINVELADPNFAIDKPVVIETSNIEFSETTGMLVIYINDSVVLKLKVESYKDGVFSGLYYVGDIALVPSTVRIANGKYIFNTVISASGTTVKNGDVLIITVK